MGQKRQRSAGHGAMLARTVSLLDQCANPAAFDALRASQPWHTLIGQLPGESDLVNIRRAYLALSGPVADMVAAAEALSNPDLPAPAAGIRLLLLSQLGHFNAVLDAGYRRRGTSELDQEEACHAHAALSVTYDALGYPRDAYASVRIALEHAQALGMRDRAHYLAMLAGRQASHAGRPDPLASGALMQVPMPKQRFAYGLRNWAEDYMALGDYRQALTVLGPPDADDVRAVGLRAFLHTVLGLPLVRDYDPNDQAYGSVTAGLQRLFDGKYDASGLLEIPHEPQATYGRLVAAAMYAAGGHMTHEEVNFLLGEQPLAPDRAALWALVRWLANPDSREEPWPHLKEVELAARSWRTSRDILSIVARFSPDAFLLLRSSPIQWPGLVPALDHVPVLYGDQLYYRAAAVEIPGRIGRTLVNNAMDVKGIELERSETSRLQKRLREHDVPGRFGNYGYVVRGLARASVAAALVDPALAETWRKAHETAAKRLRGTVAPTFICSL